MYKCMTCGRTTERNVKFCTQCGGRMVSDTPAYEPIEPPRYYYSSPSAPVTAPKVSMGKKIVSLVLSITGMSIGLFGLFYVSMLASLSGDVALVAALVLAIFGGTTSIMGLCFCGSCTRAGDRSAFTRLSKTFGIVGAVCTGVFLFIGVVAGSTYSGYPYYYYY